MISQLSYSEIGAVVIGVTFCVGVIYIIKLFFHIVCINDKIEILTQARDLEIKQSKHAGGTISGFESAKKAITERYSEKIDSLNRRKGYILDILPFIPKTKL